MGMWSMPILGGSRGMPPRKITLSEIESEGIFSVLMPLWHRYTKCLKKVAITCMPISMQLSSYCLFVLLPAIAINAIINAISWFNIGLHMAGGTTHAGKSGHALTNITYKLMSALSKNTIRTIKTILATTTYMLAWLIKCWFTQPCGNVQGTLVNL